MCSILFTRSTVDSGFCPSGSPAIVPATCVLLRSQQPFLYHPHDRMNGDNSLERGLPVPLPVDCALVSWFGYVWVGRLMGPMACCGVQFGSEDLVLPNGWMRCADSYPSFEPYLWDLREIVRFFVQNLQKCDP